MVNSSLWRLPIQASSPLCCGSFYTRWIAGLTAEIFAISGVQVVADGTYLRHSDFVLDIRRGCDGLVASVMLLCAFLAYPASWRDRLRALLPGFLPIF